MNQIYKTRIKKLQEILEKKRKEQDDLTIIIDSLSMELEGLVTVWQDEALQ